MILIDLEKCIVCGMCTKICHEHCLKIENNILSIDYKFCSTCSQCIAICPQQAITWDNIKPEFFEKTLYPDSQQIGEFLKERHTIRDFKNQKIDRSILEEITSYATYAPTNNFNLRAVIIDDEKLINQIDSMIYKFSINIYNLLYKPKIIQLLIKMIVPEREFEFIKLKPKLENTQKIKSGFKTKPAAIIMIVGNNKVPLSKESAQYALYNIDLYAQSKGIECCIIVGTQMILNGNKKFRILIGLGTNEKILGSIIMGYSTIKFRNKVLGKNIKIQWNSINK